MSNKLIENKKIKIVVKRNRFIINLISLLVMLILSIFCLENALCTYVMSWMGNLLLVLRIIDCKKIKGDFFNQYTLFISIVFLYVFGRTFLFSIGVINIDEIVKLYELSSINKYLLFAVPSFYIFTIPIAFWQENENSSKIRSIENKNNIIMKNCVSITFGLLFVISISFYLADFFDFITTALLNGYAANFIESQATGSIFDNIRIFFIPSVIFFVVNSQKILFKYIFLILLVIPGISYMFVGARGRAMALLICALFLWLTDICKSKRKGKYMLPIIIGGLVVLGLFSTLREIRDHSLGTPIEIIKLFLSNNIFDGIIATVKEIGSSMYIWIMVEQIVPITYEFKMGYSYLASVLACIPSGLIGYSFANDAALDVWLTKISGANYGLGFSMLAESYCNFGYFGIILIYFLGLFIFYFLSGNILKNRDVRYRNAISAIALYIFTNTARNALALSVRNIFYGIIIPLILMKMIQILLSCSKKG